MFSRSIRCDVFLVRKVHVCEHSCIIEVEEVMEQKQESVSERGEGIVSHLELALFHLLLVQTFG